MGGKGGVGANHERSPRTARASASAGVAALGLALAALAGLTSTDCELVVGDSIPAYACLPDPGSCPVGYACDTTIHRCVRCETASACPSSDASVGAAIDATRGGDAQDRMLDAGALVDDATRDARPPPPVADASDAAPTAVDAGDGTCTGLTCPCTGAASCASGVCADKLSLRPGVYENAGNSFCTQPCCSSADCGGSTVCYGTGGGGNYCVAPAWVGRSSTPGGAIGGATCHAHSDCRSGLCVGGACADTCCSGAQASSACAGTRTCRIAPFPGLPASDGGASVDTHMTGQCLAPVGAKSNGTACVGDNECQSGKCSTAAGGRCEGPCRDTAECRTQGLACYDSPPSLGSSDIVASCVLSPGVGTMGSSCSNTTDCQSNFCDMQTGACSDVCFSDEDCAPAKMGWRCLPEIVTVQSGGSYSVLRCGR